MVDRLVNTETNKRRIEVVEACFGTFGSKLAIPGRVLVGEGVLTKICRKKPKHRQFYLFNDILVYGSILISKKKYNKQHIIPLEGVTLQDMEDSEVAKNGWLIKTPTKSFAVFAATTTEKVEWMAHINKCIDDLIKRTGKQQTDDHAAVWIPDSDTKICMHCNKTQFTLINRRHHCRGCGKVTCNSCSKNKFLIPAQSSKPVRVCDSCFSSLCHGRTSVFENDGQSDDTEGPVNGLSTQVVQLSGSEAGGKEGTEQPLTLNTEKQGLLDGSDSDEDDDPSLDESTEDLDSVGDVIGEKPTFYSTSFSIEERSPISSPEQARESAAVMRKAPPPPPASLLDAVPEVSAQNAQSDKMNDSSPVKKEADEPAAPVLTQDVKSGNVKDAVVTALISDTHEVTAVESETTAKADEPSIATDAIAKEE